LVEQRTENPRVDGSIPSLATISSSLASFARSLNAPRSPIKVGGSRVQLRSAMSRNCLQSAGWPLRIAAKGRGQVVESVSRHWLAIGIASY
jgi:hypothetical protein